MAEPGVKWSEWADRVRGGAEGGPRMGLDELRLRLGGPEYIASGGWARSGKEAPAWRKNCCWWWWWWWCCWLASCWLKA